MSSDRPNAPNLAEQPPSGNGANPEPYYIVATSPAADEQTRVLKQGDTFAVFDHQGDIKPAGLGEEGLFHNGTRFLSRLVLGLGRTRPMFLSSTVKQENDLLAVDLTNPDFSVAGQIVIPRGTLHLSRTKFLQDGVCYERLHLRSYQADPVQTTLVLQFDADFADIFEVRGAHRPQRGRSLGAAVEPAVVVLSYEGLDRTIRMTRLHFQPAPTALRPHEARFDVHLPRQGEASFDVIISCEEAGRPKPRLLSFDKALAKLEERRSASTSGACRVDGSNERFDDWINRARADLHMMTTDTDKGPYPYAGVPWFSTPFGRDGIITAIECLSFDPGLAHGVLGFLAATQATEVIPEQDAQPGKILHEARGGEMAALGEIPFGRYYGSVDSTPLFVLLAGLYFERTGNRAFLESIWPNIESALHWIDAYGDLDGDGFVEYCRRTSKGLVNQGWKDAHDSIFHADGALAEPPIALCEVQGYVYAAKRAIAAVARQLGRAGLAMQLESEADRLQERFEAVFWCDDLNTYALALDGRKQPCRVRSSNAGHCLFTGIADRQRARRTAATLLNGDSFSGWGIRTIAATEARYNPMSYHNGSVWPHDNALIAWGLSRYGLQTGAMDILTGMFEASKYLDLHRLPELFCGFPLRTGEGPTLYPVACAPQAWSAAAVFLLVQSCLGLTVSAPQKRVCFFYPQLPDFLQDLRIHNLRVDSASVDLLLRRHGKDVGINVLRREGEVEISMVK
jgi:glycogen debranching enzyme